MRALIFNFFCVAVILGLSSCKSTLRSSNSQAPVFINIAENGRMQADIVIPDGCDESVKKTALFLSDYFGKITGVAPKVMEYSVPRNAPVEIHVGLTEYAQNKNYDLTTWDVDEFMIVLPDPNRLVLIGATTRALEYAVYELLQRFCGVRWLFPGKLGTEIPKNPSLKLNVVHVHEKPAFLSRRLSSRELWGDFEGPKGGNIKSDLAVWARHHREHGRIDFSHSLGRRIFNPDLLAESHPEIFPIINGERLIPLDGAQGTSRGGGWQPCFTHPKTLDIGADVVLENLRAMPMNLKTFALGVNDRGGHCTCEKCSAVDRAKLNYINKVDHSGSYFTWANALAEKVVAEFPDAKLGFLAYDGVAAPPESMPVHASLIPYITSDRIKWIDPELKSRDIEINRIWQAAVPEIGWYDYIYGRQYMAPRVYFNIMAEYLRWGYANSVRYYYAEAYPADDWHEGPKFSLTLALLWNPSLDVDAFLDDWYVAAVGPEAAPLLRGYFDFWENYWTTAVPQTAWFKSNSLLQYFLYQGVGYLRELRLDEIVKLRELAQRLPDMASPDKHARAQFLAEGIVSRLDAIKEIVLRNESVSIIKPGSDERLMVDDKFEVMDKQWTVWTRKHAHVNSKIIEEFDGIKGVLSLDMTHADGSPVHLMRRFELQERGRIYRAVFRVKGSRLSEPATVSVRFFDKQGKNMHDLSVSARPLYLSGDVWQDAEIVFHVPDDFPPEADKFSIHISLPEADKGYIFVDSFMLLMSTPDLEIS